MKMNLRLIVELINDRCGKIETLINELQIDQGEMKGAIDDNGDILAGIKDTIETMESDVDTIKSTQESHGIALDSIEIQVMGK